MPWKPVARVVGNLACDICARAPVAWMYVPIAVERGRRVRQFIMGKIKAVLCERCHGLLTPEPEDIERWREGAALRAWKRRLAEIKRRRLREAQRSP